jgi:NAD(P)-dependent dehydrogenase (short-subunit alcohol dehydrogenase family)
MLASRNPAKIYITGRKEAAAQHVIAEIMSTGLTTEVVFIRCDHADLASVKTAANEISKESRLDVLMANAGIMALPPGKQFAMVSYVSSSLFKQSISHDLGSTLKQCS